MSQIDLQERELALEEIELLNISETSTDEDVFKIFFSIEYLNAAYNSYIRKRPVRGLDGMSLKAFDKVRDAQIAHISERVLQGKYKFALRQPLVEEIRALAMAQRK